MLGYVSRRLLNGLLVLFVLSILAFGLVRLLPGDPVSAKFGASGATPEQIEAVREQLGLNGPAVTQYFKWLGRVLSGNLGQSFVSGRPVTTELQSRILISIELAIFASILAFVFGVAAGIISASRKGKTVDGVVRGASFMAMSIPPFVVGAVCVLLVSKFLPRWPVTGVPTFTSDPLGNLQSLLLPALVLSLPLGAVISRFTRASLLEVLGQDFVRTARAKGAGDRRVVLVHGLRNALVPVVTVSGVQLAGLVGGAVIIEQIFVVPGVGSAMVQSISSSDYPMMQACILVIGLIFVILNLLVDLLYPVIDPRMRVRT